MAVRAAYAPGTALSGALCVKTAKIQRKSNQSMEFAYNENRLENQKGYQERGKENDSK